MARDKFMEGYARDCIRLAGMTSDAEIREELLKMAGHWTEAASGSKQQQAATQDPRQSIHDTTVSTRRRNHVAGVGAKKQRRAPSAWLQRQDAPSGDGRASGGSAPNNR